MAFSSDSTRSRMVDMNITPLVDVMLVLLIIFMVTMPLRTYPIGVDLPQRSIIQQPPPRVAPIRLRIDASGQIIWNGNELSQSALRDTMEVEAERYVDPTRQPVIEIDAASDAHYDVLAKVLATARNAGLIKIGFVDKGQR
ncbi:MAG TPA: biopolymer transporter ExbD [Xanthomonadaceae bacterium]|jgi:biopolymer transport protein ExbD|nr:biopolymer transporter ExbD [Xanthomonadaceae bacterium]